MKKPVFIGTATALVTPFRDGEIDYECFHRLLDRQIEAEIEAVVLCGTTGEASTLSDAEEHSLLADGIRYVDGRMKVIAGTGSNSTAHAVELSRFAEHAGADALLCVTPYYNKANINGLIRHFTEIADAVSIPVILYNVPSRTGVDIPISVYKSLSEHPNIQGVKEACGDLSKIAKMRSELSEDFFIWSGNDDQTVPILSLGGIGLISVLSNVKPKETLELVHTCLDGNYKKAERMQSRLMPLINALFCEVNPIPVKEALRLCEIDAGTCRLPLGELSEEHRILLSEVLKKQDSR